MPNDRGPEGLLTLVCVTCGNELFVDRRVPDHPVCPRCGSTVFREFFTPIEPDEATLSNLEETARSMALDEESPDTTPDDVREVNDP